MSSRFGFKWWKASQVAGQFLADLTLFPYYSSSRSKWLLYELLTWSSTYIFVIVKWVWSLWWSVWCETVLGFGRRSSKCSSNCWVAFKNYERMAHLGRTKNFRWFRIFVDDLIYFYNPRCSPTAFYIQIMFWLTVVEVTKCCWLGLAGFTAAPVLLF